MLSRTPRAQQEGFSLYPQLLLSRRVNTFGHVNVHRRHGSPFTKGMIDYRTGSTRYALRCKTTEVAEE